MGGTMKISNAFSAGMLACPVSTVRFAEITRDEAVKRFATGVESAVGHTDTAALFSALLGMEVPVNRVSLSLPPGEEIIIGQYTGPRLPEGATTLPEGAAVRWLHAVVS